MGWSEYLGIFVAAFGVILAAMLAWGQIQASNRMLRLEMFRVATEFAAKKRVDRTYMDRVAGVFMWTQLANQDSRIIRFLGKRGEYDEVVSSLLEIYLRYNRLSFPKNAPGNHREGQLDYRSKEYVLIRDWINTRAPRRITSKIIFPEEDKFKMYKGKLEANENSEDYKKWMEATGGEPPY